MPANFLLFCGGGSGLILYAETLGWRVHAIVFFGWYYHALRPCLALWNWMDAIRTAQQLTRTNTYTQETHALKNSAPQVHALWELAERNRTRQGQLPVTSEPHRTGRQHTPHTRSAQPGNSCLPFFGRACLPHGGRGLSDRRNRRRLGDLSPDAGRRGGSARAVEMDKELADKFALNGGGVVPRDVGVQAMVVGFDVGVQAGDGYHTGMEIEVMARCLCFSSARWFLFF
jgi:hypothetical protein